MSRRAVHRIHRPDDREAWCRLMEDEPPARKQPTPKTPLKPAPRPQGTNRKETPR